MLDVSDLACVRGGRLVLTNVSFKVSNGELLAVRGPNGAGKSTLLRLLAGLLRPRLGAITLHGRDEERDIAEFCHYVGHLDTLKPALSVAETLQLWQQTMGEPRLDPLQALDRFDVARLIDLPCGYLSAGQRRRVALSRLLINHRPIWLLDEPTSALDKASEGLLGAIMQEHVATGGIIIAATHLDLPLSQDIVRLLTLERPTITALDDMEAFG